MAQIFISYSRKDTEIVDLIHRKLSASGFDIWLDRKDIYGGDLWRRKIVEAISTCLTFVIVLSPNSIQSDNVRKELDIAEGKGKKIYPVMISNTNIPAEMEYQLAGVQIIDLTTNLDAGLNHLIESLRVEKPIAASPISTSTPARQVRSPKASSATGTIQLVRSNAKDYSGGIAGNYGIWVDNKKVGTLAYGKKLSLVVSMGTHQIYVEWMAMKSNVLQFSIDNNQTITLMCGEKQGMVLGTFFVDFMD